MPGNHKKTTLIKPLTLGSRTFPSNLIQGPLAGVSCAPFRRLTWQYSEPAFSCTEMLSCKTLIHQPAFSIQRYIKKDPYEGPVCFQLSGNNVDDLAIATRKVTEAGADLIDLNCGCPVNKIRSKGAGSRLLTNPTMLYQLVCTMKQNTHLPVSIKIRVEGNDEKFNQEIARVVSEAGADFLIVHGRHWTESYDIPCRYDDIQFFVEQMNIPVIGNGDISNVDSLRKMFLTGCAGVMISRAGMGRPWLLRQLRAEMNQEPFVVPLSKEIGGMLIEHVEQLSFLLGNEKFAILQARKFAKYYAREVLNKVNFITAINDCNSLQELKTICAAYFI
jgi:tRNA-dihydrouridine synthase B